MQQVKKFITNKYMMFLYGTIFIFLLWWIISLLVNSLAVPSPISTIALAFEYLKDGYTYICLGYSLLRMIIGFLIAFIVAFILALIVNDNEKAYQFFTPLMTFFKAIPTAALVFLFIVLIGAQSAPILVVILIAIPILYEAIVGGLKNSDDELLEAAEIDGAKKINRLFRIQLPLSVPFIIVGMISTFSLSFKIEIMAEVITGYTRNGLGSLIKGAQISDPTDLTPVFAYSFIAVMLMLLVTLGAYLITQKLKKDDIFQNKKQASK